MNDTLPEIEIKMHRMMAARSGSERLVMGASMFETARAIVISSFPKDLSEEEFKRRLCERTYGVPLKHFMTKVFDNQ